MYFSVILLLAVTFFITFKNNLIREAEFKQKNLTELRELSHDLEKDFNEERKNGNYELCRKISLLKVRLDSYIDSRKLVDEGVEDNFKIPLEEALNEMRNYADEVGDPYHLSTVALIESYLIYE
jgi:hypothetical protein